MSARVNFKINVPKITKAVQNAVLEGMWDVVDDLQRTASETTPLDKGFLEKSWAKDVTMQGKSKVTGYVSFSVREGDEDWNGFNYALRMHEDIDYELGEKSKQKPGGTGMSGKKYEVGPKYLTRVADGERETYHQHIQNMINEAIK